MSTIDLFCPLACTGRVHEFYYNPEDFTKASILHDFQMRTFLLTGGYTWQ